MTITVIGATGKVGVPVIQDLLAAGRGVRALVRDPAKAATLFGDSPLLEIVAGRLDEPDTVASALRGAEAAFVALHSFGLQGNLQRIAIDAARRADLPQLVRLSVLNTSPDSLGINQRGHADIDFMAGVADIPYTTLRPAIFTATMLSGAEEIRRDRSWTGLTDTGRVGLIHTRDVAEVAVRLLTDPTTWGKHYDLTGPTLLSWPEAVALLSAELGTPLVFRVATEAQLLERLRGAGVGMAELTIAREWAVRAGENEHLSDGVRELTGHEPRTVEEFLHENRAAFLP